MPLGGISPLLMTQPTDCTPSQGTLVSPLDAEDLAGVRRLYQQHGHTPAIQNRYQPWQALLQTALGATVQTPEQQAELFVRHTYLSMVIAMGTLAYFDPGHLQAPAVQDPISLLTGRLLEQTVGIQASHQPDFFAWPAEVAAPAVLWAGSRAYLPVCLGPGPAGYSRYPIPATYPRRRPPATRRVLHPLLASPADGPRGCAIPSDPAGTRPRMWLRYILGRGRATLRPSRPTTRACPRGCAGEIVPSRC